MMRAVSVWDGDGSGPPRISPDHEKLPTDIVARVVAYLDAAPCILRTTATSEDVVEPGRAKVGLSVYTDGEWIWGDSLRYYIESYGLAPSPGDFLRRLEQRDFMMPSVTDEQLREAAELLRVP